LPPFFLASDITARARYRTLKPSVMRNSMSAFSASRTICRRSLLPNRPTPCLQS
jgi:hypothetical protein